MDVQSPSDEALAARVRAGDRDALGALYDRHAAAALGTALRVVADRPLAEDIVHDAFVTLWQKIALYDARKGSVRAWLLTIVRNRAIDHVRATRPSIEVELADQQSLLVTSGNPTWRAAVANLSAAELRAAIATLPPEQQQAITLAYFGGHTYREIATLTGVPHGTASSRLRLALEKLRGTLGGSDAAPLAAGRGPGEVDP